MNNGKAVDCSTEKKELFTCNSCGKKFLLPVRDDVPWEDLALLGVVGFVFHTECPECGGYMSKSMPL